MQFSLSLPKYSNSSSEFTPLASFLDTKAYVTIESFANQTGSSWNKELTDIYTEISAKFQPLIDDDEATEEAKTALEVERENEKAAASATYVSGKVNALDSSRFTEFFSRLSYKLHSVAGFDVEDITNDTGDWIKLSWSFKDSDAASEDTGA